MDQWKYGTEECPPLLIPMKNDLDRIVMGFKKTHDRGLMAMDNFLEVLKGFDRWRR